MTKSIRDRSHPIKTTFTATSGPLPSPETLAKFEQVLPGLAERIVMMAEREAAHRHQQEASALEADIRIAHKDRAEALAGQIFGFVIGMTTVICGTWLVASGHHVPGAIIGSAGVAGLVSVFIAGRTRWSASSKKGH